LFLDKALTPYKSGPKIINFFNLFGNSEEYGQGFPARYEYVQNKLREFNITPTKSKII
jgi:hypothetical protein